LKSSHEQLPKLLLVVLVLVLVVQQVHSFNKLMPTTTAPLIKMNFQIFSAVLVELDK
jgi:hypothetical protein